MLVEKAIPVRNGEIEEAASENNNLGQIFQNRGNRRNRVVIDHSYIL